MSITPEITVELTDEEKEFLEATGVAEVEAWRDPEQRYKIAFGLLQMYAIGNLVGRFAPVERQIIFDLERDFGQPSTEQEINVALRTYHTKYAEYLRSGFKINRPGNNYPFGP